MKFTPEVLLSAPRRSAGVPNPSGTKVIYTVSTYNFETHTKAIELKLLDVESGESPVLAKDDEVSDFNWLDDETFLCLQAEKDGKTSLYAANVSKVSSTGVTHYVVGSIDAAASNLKVCKLDPEGKEVAIVVSAQASPDGSLYTVAKSKRKTHSTGRLYSSLYVRHWDRYETPERNSLWYGKLTRGDVGKYQLSDLSNALKGTGLECPVPPFGGTDNFDIRSDGLILVAKDPKLNPALHVKCNVYLVSIKSWTQSESVSIEEIPVLGFEGAASCPVFDPKGERAAFLMMKDDGYEADKNRIFIIADVKAQTAKKEAACITLEAGDGDEGFWNRSPQFICFSNDGQSLYATAEDRAVGRLYKVDIAFGSQQTNSPQPLLDDGYVSDMKPLSNDRVFVTASTLIDGSTYAILRTTPNLPSTSRKTWTHSLSATGSKFNLNPNQISSIWTPSSNPRITKNIHSLVIKPSTFSSTKTYPVAYLIHGGPQGSWADSWSTRWNPAVFAEQGYVVIAPNPTGSTGYGQEFTNAIQNNWGGDPYEDIVKCFEWVGENMPEADNGRAVALGASYGGYMVREADSLLPVSGFPTVRTLIRKPG